LSAYINDELSQDITPLLQENLTEIQQEEHLKTSFKEPQHVENITQENATDINKTKKKKKSKRKSSEHQAN
jgi:hypothetical protein